MEVQHRESTNQLMRDLYREATAIIQRKYEDPLDINSVASEIATSRRQLQRAFAAAGTSFSNYLTEVRLQNAARLLREGGMSVHDIAHTVGYKQHSQFAKMFRRRFGVPPSTFKPRRDNGSARAEEAAGAPGLPNPRSPVAGRFRAKP
jgi:AraC-like DNA-binding protein